MPRLATSVVADNEGGAGNRFLGQADFLEHPPKATHLPVEASAAQGDVRLDPDHGRVLEDCDAAHAGDLLHRLDEPCQYGVALGRGQSDSAQAAAHGAHLLLWGNFCCHADGFKLLHVDSS